MKLKTSIVMLSAVLSLVACTDPNRFDNLDGAGSGLFGRGADGSGLGSASDPASAAYFQQAVGDRVLFLVDQSSLTVAARATLDWQAEWLLTNTDYTAVIEGHADEQGTREYNLALGARRADAARAYLVSKGVPSGRLQVLSYGKERPTEVCSQETCYAKNRRAVTVLTAGLSG
ncbi:MAG: peptidoglycan-associated lipoprotein Pal [Tateyamaria sp.]|jgi:peptidoglycan-associated lipoprotein|nr:peptidoglycan-associated lipoprotein Pal [Tateyamaria sp.]MDG1182959.1 peptidoglycan-associated lipoprotein Pal [Tateyamaria sp.]MDG1334784.1 peptidoglycan-associated lipoprotein Pal [Tateyamaria sp.]MDG2058349.1 peptidoglycan-associated lipoprotein Pal [Tateyamaria sp.]